MKFSEAAVPEMYKRERSSGSNEKLRAAIFLVLESRKLEQC